MERKDPIMPQNAQSAPYRTLPRVAVHCPGVQYQAGFAHIAPALKAAAAGRRVVTVDCYPGVDQAELAAGLAALDPVLVIHSDDLALEPEKLDAALDSYFRQSLFSVSEIDEHNERRRKLRALTRDIYKHMGLWCENPDQAAEVYVSPWLAKGFEEKALLKIADQCFTRGIKTMDGMNATVNKLLKEGCLSAAAIDEYLAGCAARDEVINKIIAQTGSSRTLTMNDRDLYAVWSDNWGFPDESILYAASLAQGRANAMSRVGNTLAFWKRQGAFTLEEVKKLSDAPGDQGKRPQNSMNTERTYTKQQLDAFLGDTTNFDDI